MPKKPAKTKTLSPEELGDRFQEEYGRTELIVTAMNAIIKTLAEKDSSFMDRLDENFRKEIADYEIKYQELNDGQEEPTD